MTEMNSNIRSCLRLTHVAGACNRPYGMHISSVIF